MRNKNLVITPIVLLFISSVHTQVNNADADAGVYWEKILNYRYPVFSPPVQRGHPGEHLLLSPFLEQKDGASRARNLSAVDTEHMIEGINSHAGYITVDEKYNSNLWFWYFPAQHLDSSKAPLIIWLQGGPGASSLFGLFEELGPFSVDPSGNYLVENPHSWHLNHSLLFIDNPVGTGFSFTDSEDGYCTNQTQIGEHLYIFMEQFLRIFTELQQVPLYISGESYAGKHIPSLGYQIHKNNPTAQLKINLQGLAIGNGFIDPPTMMRYGDFVYQIGLADINLANKMRVYEHECEAALVSRNYRLAFRFFNAILGSFIEESEVNSLYNYQYEDTSGLYGPFTKFIQKTEIRMALHVGTKEFSSIGKVYYKLIDDFMGTSKPWLEELVENYKVMAFSGHLDIICAYPLSERTYRSMVWNGSAEYLSAKRKPWYYGNILAGYVKKSGLFQDVMIRNAGHMVPTDQPSRSLLLISSFIRDIPLQDKDPEDVDKVKLTTTSEASENDVNFTT